MWNETIELLKYLQKTKWLPRRVYSNMISKKSIKINDIIVEKIDSEIKKWDKLEIILENGEKYIETIKKIPSFKPTIVLFNKPKWCVASKDDKHNKTIYEYLPASWKKDFYYIWRLDKDSHWLLLLTNDPKLVDYYENPKNKVFKIYKVIIDKPYKTKDILKAKKWVPVDEDWNLVNLLKRQPWEKYELLKVHNINSRKNEKWQITLEIVLTEWKKRHIRRLLAALSYKVLDLQRIKFWKYQIWTIKPGKYMISKL